MERDMKMAKKPLTRRGMGYENNSSRNQELQLMKTMALEKGAVRDTYIQLLMKEREKGWLSFGHII